MQVAMFGLATGMFNIIKYCNTSYSRKYSNITGIFINISLYINYRCLCNFKFKYIYTTRSEIEIGICFLYYVLCMIHFYIFYIFHGFYRFSYS